jgi:putative DNA primase/helicase
VGGHSATRELQLAKAAIWYGKHLGLRIFPLHPGGKRPIFSGWPESATDDPQQLSAWWREHLAANIGVLLGEPSGVFLFDVDVKDATKDKPAVNGYKTLEKLEKEHGPLPPTWRAKTGGGGEHYFFKHPGFHVSNADGTRAYWKGIDIKGERGYAVLAPSLHPDTQELYHWIEGHRPSDVELADAPEWVLKRLREGAKKKTAAETKLRLNDTGEKIPRGKRHEAVLGLAGWMRARNYPTVSIEAALRAMSEHGCEDHDDAEHQRDIKHTLDTVRGWDPRSDVRAPSPEEQSVLRKPQERLCVNVSDKQVGAILDHAWTGLIHRNDPPRLFRMELELIELREGKTIAVGPHGMYRLLAENIIWRRNGKDGELEARVPDKIAPAMLTKIPRGIPELEGLARVPCYVGPAWDLRCEPGFVEDDKTFFLGKSFDASAITAEDDINEGDVEVALASLLNDWLGDFEFASEPDKTAALGLLLTLMGRRAIAGRVPAFLVEAPTEGTGKSTLAECLFMLALGDVPPAHVGYPRDEAEAGKTMLALLRNSAEVLYFDNVNFLGGTTFAGLVTNGSITQRVLATSRVTTVPFAGTFVATGNNPSVDPEATRRALRIRLIPRTETPWKGRSFKHKGIVGHTRRRRLSYLWALHVLVRWWRKQGCPKGIASLGSFEGWSEAVGGILSAAGRKDLVSNATLERMFEKTEMAAELQEFIDYWFRTFGLLPVRPRRLVELATRTGEFLNSLEDYSMLLPGTLGKVKVDARPSVLGRYLARIEDRVIGDLRVVRTTETTSGHRAWQLVQEEQNSE